MPAAAPEEELPEEELPEEELPEEEAPEDEELPEEAAPPEDEPPEDETPEEEPEAAPDEEALAATAPLLPEHPLRLIASNSSPPARLKVLLIIGKLCKFLIFRVEAEVLL